MLMTRAKRPATRTLRGWAISVLQEAGAIKEWSTAGCRTGRIRSPANALWTSRERNDRPEFRRRRRPSPSPKCSTRSATAAPNARRPERRARGVIFPDKPVLPVNEIVNDRTQGMGRDLEGRQRYRQLEPPPARAAGIEVEHPIDHIDLRNVRMA
jgi:hypothetical protein